MFKFLAHVGSLANKKGFRVSKIEVKIPSVKFETVSLVNFNLSIPKMESPEMLFTIDIK
jgi:hypothetical protein